MTAPLIHKFDESQPAEASAPLRQIKRRTSKILASQPLLDPRNTENSARLRVVDKPVAQWTAAALQPTPWQWEPLGSGIPDEHPQENISACRHSAGAFRRGGRRARRDAEAGRRTD